jgi:hypothetical protein
MAAVERVCADGVLTADVGGTATTAEVTEAVCAAIRARTTDRPRRTPRRTDDNRREQPMTAIQRPRVLCRAAPSPRPP